MARHVCRRGDITSRSIQTEIIEAQETAGLSIAGGQFAKTKVIPETKPVIEDWEVFYSHIKDKDDFSFLNKAVNARTIRLHWDEGEEVPGVGRIIIKKLSLTKV